ncbi:MAG TPA: peptidoglycan DD-metalloendopeptidase family protein [Paracoccaceae bacterium]|nr:peptidoglycan DD-metalloendopeptidase family protein [Paracoccaceae bacterium]
MSVKISGRVIRAAAMGVSLLALAACESNGLFDGDLRHLGQGGFDTSDAVFQATANRPVPDARGIISYPGYQVAVARQGDTVTSVAARVGIPAAELASYNALAPNAPLRRDEVLALPRRVEGGALPATGVATSPLPATTPGTTGGIDVTTIASGAIDRADAGKPAASAPATKPAAATKPTGAEPLRHKVERGESAYSIARLYNVNVKALADWNGLGNDLTVREGQTLLIPVSAGAAPKPEPVTAPGEGSPTPTPPSASKPLPDEKPAPASEPVKTPPAPDLDASAPSAKLAMPVSGKIIRGYQKKKNDGIDIAASAGTSVAAAGDGTVAAITKDTEGVPILVVRHAGNLLTVYANIDAINVKKGDKVKRGQAIAKVRASSPAFLHFEVRQGFDSVDPMPYLQ